MAKIKLTKNELKKQKDALKMYERYLPTLMLKKQQLQMEIRVVEGKIARLEDTKKQIQEKAASWIAVFGEVGICTPDLIRIQKVHTERGNIAGVDIPLYKGVDFSVASYDVLRTPLWLDAALSLLSRLLELDVEIQVLQEQQKRLEQELRTTSQRVNLFEKVKIPETKANIKKIRVYLGDQQTAAVVRGKIAKRAMERVSQ
ncbi:MAG: V-type ATP synthase subunit D [Treponemataceae bacterium]|nr:V-type ATP synthase subunit D [Treponemataceae bacterium]